MKPSAQSTAHQREPHMKTERLKTVVSLARTMARQDIRLAAEYLRDQGLALGLARHILRQSMQRRTS